MKHLRWLGAALALTTIALAQSEPITIRQAVETARTTSPTVQAARAEVEAARQAVAVARARRAPQLSANAFATSSKPGAILSSSPGVMPSSIMGMPGGETAVLNLMLMVPIFTGGTLDAQTRVATAQERAALGELAEMTGETDLMVREAYLMALLATENVRREEARVTAAEEMVRTMQARFEAGSEIRATVARAEAELAMARRERVMAANERAKALLDLRAAMGVPLDRPLELADALALAPVAATLETLIDRASSERGALLAARAQVEAAEADVRAAEGALRPQVYGVAMNDASTDRMMNGPTFGITLSLPLFDAGERRADVRRMRAMRERAQGQLRQSQLNVEKEVRQAWLDLQTAQENARSAQASVEAATASYEAVRLRVEAGRAILLEQLDALQTLTQARAELARALYDHSLAVARLQRASGVELPQGENR